VKESAERSLREANEVYLTAHLESRHSQSDEAFSLGVDTSTVNNYFKLDSDRHLPFGLAPLSIYAPQLMDWFAAKIGGCFITLKGHMNGTSADEIRRICKAIGDLQTETDRHKRERLFLSIEQNAAKARKEEEV
jgi:hypothetical protein